MITPLAPYPAALVDSLKTRTMVIADLHIGWEIALAQEGIHVPSQTPKLLKKLKEVIGLYKPERLLILGDVKHTVATAQKGEWHDVPEFFNGLKEQVREISVIRGNHDGNLQPLLPENVNILPATGITLNDTGFFHGHQWPSPSLLKCKTLVMGHVHPVVAFRDPSGFRVTRQVWVKADCNGAVLTQTLLQKKNIRIEGNAEKTLRKRFRTSPKTARLFIVPSFNDFLGGRPLNENRPTRQTDKGMVAGPVLRSEAVDMKRAETYLLDGTFLGTIEQLMTLS